MDFDDQVELEHLLFFDRKCRICGEVKSLLDDFYLTRKDRGTLASAYSYECKVCTKKRVNKNKKKRIVGWEYPDW
jgi:alpha-D-ribose 1-methylphosphonate 5-phosphate C-P lyase